jgi:nucleotide-binding universal stress UspA family protein
MKLIALVDNSMYARSVCDYAAWLAERSGAGIDIIHVLDRRTDSIEVDNFSGSIGLGARTELLEELAELDAQNARLAHKLGRAILEDAQSRVLDAGAGVGEVSTRLRNGDILEAIEDFEADAELIVIGKRGEAADFDKLLPGSNLESVVRFCKKPVLVASRAFK